MDRAQWRQPTDPSSAARRAGGRRLFNAARQAAAAERRALVAEIALRLQIKARGGSTWGTQRLIAESLGVHPSTISRDLKRSRALVLRRQSCPFCGQLTRRK